MTTVENFHFHHKIKGKLKIQTVFEVSIKLAKDRLFQKHGKIFI
jgi:hypothetical protein